MTEPKPPTAPAASCWRPARGARRGAGGLYLPEVVDQHGGAGRIRQRAGNDHGRRRQAYPANVEAFKTVGWTKAEQTLLLEQWNWVTEVPQIPGNYTVVPFSDQCAGARPSTTGRARGGSCPFTTRKSTAKSRENARNSTWSNLHKRLGATILGKQRKFSGPSGRG